jgi:hypothetical protein
VAVDLYAGSSDDVVSGLRVSLGIDQMTVLEAEDGAVCEQLIEVSVRIPRRPWSARLLVRMGRQPKVECASADADLAVGQLDALGSGTEAAPGVERAARDLELIEYLGDRKERGRSSGVVART